MKHLLSAALLGSSALLSAAQAQTPAAPAGTAVTIADCDRLQTFLEQRRPANPGVTVEQIRTYRTANNAQACHDALVRLDPTAASGTATAITVQQAAPAIRVEQGAPQVSVVQPQPNVNVRQAVPEIIVRQAPPTITVQMPNPEIVVRMPEPEVNVAMAQPQVSVAVPKPDVQVVQPAQPNVQVQQAPAPAVNVQAPANQQANVQVERAQPKVTFERAGEAKVIMNQAEGQPTIRVEQMGAAAGGAAAGAAAPARTAAVATGGAASTAAGNLTATRLKGMDVYGTDNQKLGDVERVVQTTDNKAYLVVGFGGFLGLGERRVAIPVEQVQSRGDRLVVSGLTNDQLKALPAFDAGNRFRDAEANFSPVFGR